MMSGGAKFPASPAGQSNPVRRCDKCETEMKQLGQLPALAVRAAIRVFRCYACNHVVSDLV